MANDSTRFYFLTDKDAPQYKLVSVDLADPPEQRVFHDVIPEDKDAHLDDVRAVNHNYLIAKYKRNVGTMCSKTRSSPSSGYSNGD